MRHLDQGKLADAEPLRAAPRHLEIANAFIEHGADMRQERQERAIASCGSARELRTLCSIVLQQAQPGFVCEGHCEDSCRYFAAGYGTDPWQAAVNVFSA